MRVSLIALVLSLTAVSVSAHVMVSPPQSKAGESQKYELRVHNEEKLATTEVDLQIPAGVEVVSVGTAPAGSTYTTAKTGDRITALKWTVSVGPQKYLALTFTAKNPSTAQDLQWVVRATFTDGSVAEWSDKPGAEKASVTRLTGGIVDGAQSHR